MRTIDELGISPAPWDSHQQFVIANDDGSVVAATNVRDARLIAAAPDLYEALRELVMAFDMRFGLSKAARKGKAALAKASVEEAK